MGIMYDCDRAYTILFSLNFSSLALTVCDLWYFEDLEEKETF